MGKRLYKSTRDRVFAGVCGGIAEYFNVDPILVRLAWLLLFNFSGLLAYIVAAILIPYNPKDF